MASKASYWCIASTTMTWGRQVVKAGVDELDCGQASVTILRRHGGVDGGTLKHATITSRPPRVKAFRFVKMMSVFIRMSSYLLVWNKLCKINQ